MASKKDIRKYSETLIQQFLPYVSTLTSSDGTTIKGENEEYQRELAKKAAIILAKHMVTNYSKLLHDAWDVKEENEQMWPKYKGKNKLHKRICQADKEWRIVLDILKS